MRRGWHCELVFEKTGEVISSIFCTDDPIEGPADAKGFVWKSTELVAPEDVMNMVMACRNIDRDADGWYALLVNKERCSERVGRGRTAWEAVCDAHRPSADAALKEATQKQAAG